MDTTNGEFVNMDNFVTFGTFLVKLIANVNYFTSL
jgi:hypothetical protein